MPKRFVLSGYTDGDEYENRMPSFEGDTEFPDVDVATRAAREWLADHTAAAQVEVIEVERGVGRVKRVVDHRGIEDIE